MALFHLHHTEIYIHIPFEKNSRKYICCRPGKVEKKFEIYVQGAACSLENIYHIRFFQLVAYGVNYDSGSNYTTYGLFRPNTANRLYAYAQGVIAGGAVLGSLRAGVLLKRLNASAFLLIILCFSRTFGRICVSNAGYAYGNLSHLSKRVQLVIDIAHVISNSTGGIPANFNAGRFYRKGHPLLSVYCYVYKPAGTACLQVCFRPY